MLWLNGHLVSTNRFYSFKDRLTVPRLLEVEPFWEIALTECHMLIAVFSCEFAEIKIIN